MGSTDGTFSNRTEALSTSANCNDSLSGVNLSLFCQFITKGAHECRLEGMKHHLVPKRCDKVGCTLIVVGPTDRSPPAFLPLAPQG